MTCLRILLVLSFFSNQVFPMDEKHGLDLGRLSTIQEELFVPVLPLFEKRTPGAGAWQPWVLLCGRG